MKVYIYPPCTTCKKALAYLRAKGVSYEAFNIVDKRPTKTELLSVLKAYGGDMKKLFNSSGDIYKSMNLSEKLTSMSDEDALALLLGNGKLIKRPFVVSEKFKVAGFSPEQWEKEL